jgi:hypothetical protein
MRIKCPHCIHNIDVATPIAGEPIACPDCGEWIRRGNALAPVQQRRRRAMSAPVSRGRVDRYDLEAYEEEWQERREERQERREERLHRREERDDWRESRRDEKERNGFAIGGFCVVLACLLFVGGGLLFAKALPLYLGMALTLSVPLTLAGFVLSLLGVFLRKVMRAVAIAGAGIGAALLLLLIPVGFMLLKY